MPKNGYMIAMMAIRAIEGNGAMQMAEHLSSKMAELMRYPGIYNVAISKQTERANDTNGI